MTPMTSHASSEIRPLLDSLNRGDPDAREMLFERCREGFRRQARHMLGGFPKLRRDLDTSDVKQQLYVDLWKSLGEVTVNDGRHLFRLANLKLRRSLIDWARKKRE